MTASHSQKQGPAEAGANKERDSLRHLLKKDIKQTYRDFRKGDLKRTFRRDFRDLHDFYIDEGRRKRLASMNRIKRWFYILAWLLKSLFFKLTMVRRVLLLISIVLLFTLSGSTDQDGDVSISFGKLILSFMIVLFILMLELKDKLLARDELEVGRTVQLALLPDRNPAIPGWDIWLFTRPANDVGGDLVDFMKIRDNRVALALGDVAGKGLGAALLMAKLQATLRALAENFQSLAELGTQMNRIFCRDGVESRFATLVYLELMPLSGKVRVLNAGHLTPLVLKMGGMEKLSPVALPLGAMPDATYAEQRLALQPGDMLMVYSDGVTEARNEAGTFFGEERLMDILPGLSALSAEEAGIRLLSEIDHFIGEARRYDDISLMFLKCKKS